MCTSQNIAAAGMAAACSMYTDESDFNLQKMGQAIAEIKLFGYKHYIIRSIHSNRHDFLCVFYW